MRRRWERRRAPLLLAFVGLATGLAAPGAGGAGPAQQATALRGRQNTLAARSHAALLSLYSLDSRLAQARSRLAGLQAEGSTVRAEQAQAERDEAIANDAWRKSVSALGDHLRVMYEQGEPDAIAVLLGATSVDDAMTRLDALERSASVNRMTVEQARAAERSLARLRSELATRGQRIQQLEGQTEQTATALAATREQRIAYISALTRQRALNRRQIARLQTSAQQIAARSQVIAAQHPSPTPSPTPTATSTPVVGDRQLTVSATGYALAGRTATGMPVGWGVVAVDPSIIPLGTRLSIPGYGEGVAADTGSAVQGATIDLWFPTLAQALAWGRRTVTITLH